jgi:hypothetical protein
VKLPLDENLPHKLRQNLPGHNVFTTAYMNWGGIKNGELLRLAAQDGFDALITIDAGIKYEQNLATLPCAVVIVRAASNAFEHIEPHIPQLLKALSVLTPKTLVKVG